MDRNTHYSQVVQTLHHNLYFQQYFPDFAGLSVEEALEKNPIQNKDLPAVFLDFFGYRGASQILLFFSNTDQFYYDPNKIFLYQNQPYLVFGNESQGNFELSIQLNGSDDPPVFFRGYAAEDWSFYIDHFSSFLITQIFDWEWLYDHENCIVIPCLDDFKIKNNTLLDSLVTNYEPGPTSYIKYKGVEQLQKRYSVDHQLRFLVDKVINDTKEDYFCIQFAGADLNRIQVLSNEFKQYFRGYIME